ncbi:P-loop ATPase, Sll1717 family [Cellulomonas oligotrophica]|uniref:P-loop ATPase, Sll1717 family n=1 Tax=Cellulomonas oligotrophica TaxID=931536 RepID=UPI0035711B0C
MMFRDLYFGQASAETEVAQDPSRFLKNYYDRWNIANRLGRKDFFLLVGPKGAGKTATSEYIRLHLQQKHGKAHVFAKTLNLDEVSPGVSPLASITQKLVSDQATGITDAAWRLFLSLRFFEMLLSDESSSLANDPQALDLAKRLRNAGLATSDFPSVLRKVRENKISLSLKGLLTGETASKQTEEVPVSALGQSLERLVLNAQSDNHFVLSIDGLDRIIGHNPAYWLTLAALLRVGEDFHHKLISARSSLRFFVMCRSDVFRRISFADSDKIAGDSALFVDWGSQQTEPRDSPLWDYLAAKAEITPDALFEHFPPHVSVGLRSSKPRNIPTIEYILTSTRSTPREMTMLMRRLQEEVPPGGYVTSDRIRSAVDTFASRDLLTTVKAEATGLLKSDIAEHLEELLSSLPSAREVTRDDLGKSVVASGLEVDKTAELAEFLFMAGLIGNYDRNTGYIQFYHRRDTYKFKRTGPWQLHRGLMYAFNIPYSRGAANG